MTMKSHAMVGVLRLLKSIVTTVCAVIAFSMSAPVAKAVAVQWSVGAGGNDHFYEVIQAPSGITWEAANTAAMGMGGHLATITSAEENAFVFGLVDDFSSFWFTSTHSASLGPWLGGLQPAGSGEPAGGWTWVTGEAFTYENWAPGEPNDSPSSGPNENRIHFFNQTPGATAPTWNDLAAATTQPPRSYVVERPAIPEPSTALLLGLGMLGAGLIRRKRRA